MAKNHSHPLPARSFQEVADIVTNLSTHVLRARYEQQLSTRALAAQIDVAPSTVSRLESGRYPSVEVTVRVLEWLSSLCPFCESDAHVEAS